MESIPMKKFVIISFVILFIWCRNNSTNVAPEYHSKIVGTWKSSADATMFISFYPDRTFRLFQMGNQNQIGETGSFAYDSAENILILKINKKTARQRIRYVDVLVHWNGDREMELISFPSGNLLFKKIGGSTDSLSGVFWNCERYDDQQFDDGYIEFKNDSCLILELPPDMEGSLVVTFSYPYEILSTHHIKMGEEIFYYQKFEEYFFLAMEDSVVKWHTFRKQ